MLCTLRKIDFILAQYCLVTCVRFSENIHWNGMLAVCDVRCVA